MHKVTIYDVAKKCAVSPATVSRVLNNTDYPVSRELKELVTKTAHDMNYSPNLLSRALKTKNTKDIGVIVPTISNAYYSQLLQGICSAAAAKGYNVMLCSSFRDPVTENENLKFLFQKQVNGIIIVSIGSDSTLLNHIIKNNVKVVVLEQTTDAPCSKVTFDYESGMHLAVQHLIDNGHRKIGFIGAKLDRPSRRLMLDGYKRCLCENNIPINESFIRLAECESETNEQFEFSNGKKMAEKFLSLADVPTGYVCINDMTAIGAMNLFEEKGIKIPEDFSVIGFDNTPYAAFAHPPLTTVEQSAYSMGQKAMEILTENAENGKTADFEFTPQLICRSSVMKFRPHNAEF